MTQPPQRRLPAIAAALGLALLPLVGGTAPAQDPAPAAPPAAAVPGMDTITAAELGAHVTTLAADEMKGRDAQSGGIELAATYVRDQMKAIGLQPAGDTEGSYYHHFSVGMLARDLAAHTATCGGRSVAAGDGWVTLGSANGTWNGRLVHAALGVDAAWDLFEDGGDTSAVKGALVVVSKPGRLIDRETFGWLPAIAERAGKLGAVGVIHVSQNDMAARQWQSVMRMMGRGRPGGASDIAQPPGPIAVWMERAAFDQLLGADVAATVLAAEPFKPIADAPTVSITAAAAVQNEVKYKNVCGWLPGTDATLKSEYVAFSAHYDHIGMKPTPEGVDGIFNGADDDATGVAGCLELAQAFVKAPAKRSILVIAFTAEEQGLLGSKRWAANPTVPLKQIVCDFNLEMLGRPAAGGPGHLWITGYERSTLGAIVADAGEDHGVTAKADPYPFMGFFRRSDNWSLAQHGIPAHSFSSFDTQTHKDYHQPGDHADKCDFPNMQTLVRGIYAGARRVADGEATPTWAEGDPLAEKR